MDQNNSEYGHISRSVDFDCEVSTNVGSFTDEGVLYELPRGKVKHLLRLTY